MKSASYASYKAAGAIPQEPDDDCNCSGGDARRCLEDAVKHSAAEDVFLQDEEKCTCTCHARFEAAVKRYGEQAMAHIMKMIEDGAEGETLLEVVRCTVESAVRCAATDKELQ